MYLNQLIELSMVLDSKKFHKVLTTAYSKTDCLEENEKEYIDQSFAAKGIVVMYRNSQYKKKVKLLINTSLVLDCKSPSPEKLIRKLEKRISEYFQAEYQLEDFHLTRMVLMTDVNVGSQEKVSAYIKVLQRIGRVKGFSPSYDECFDESSSFCLNGNSNGVTFLIYNLRKVFVEQLKEIDVNRKKLKSVIENSEGILRAEVRLIEPKAIQAYTDKTATSKQIAILSENSRDIFLATMIRVIPFGDFHKKDTAIEIIQKEVKDLKLQRRMLRLVALIPEKKSLLLAQKSLNYRRIDDVMETFAKINISPITISKRHDVKHLKSLYSYLI